MVDPHMHLLPRLRVNDNGISAPEYFRSEHETGGDRESVGVELLLEVGLGTQKNLFVHFRGVMIDGAYNQIWVLAHHVVQHFGGQIGDHYVQSVQNRGNEVVQLLHHEGGIGDFTV
jgi:hypothetical protein